tara:strand:+ start:1736 stop:2473 length:738 start_codon:yes stop_codon:yes gene_type:complete
MAFFHNPKIPQVDKLECHFDPADQISYPAGGTVMYDLSHRKNNHNLHSWNVVSGSHMLLSGSSTPIFSSTLTGDAGTSAADASKANFVNHASSASFSFWIQKRSGSQHSNDLYSADRDDSNGVRITVDNDDKLYFNTNGQSDQLATTTNTISNFNWYNVICTMDSKRKEIYINGVLNTSTGSASTAGHDGPNIFYNRNENFGSLYGPNAAYSFRGYMGPISIWRTRLTSAEVTQHFNTFRSRYGL